MSTPFAQLDEAERGRLRAKLEALYNKKPPVWRRWLTGHVAADPALWQQAALSLFDENTAWTHVWKVLITLVTDASTAALHEELWATYLHHLAHHPKLNNSHTQWHLKKQLERIPAEYEGEVLDAALRGATGPMTVPMLEHYFGVRLCSPDIVVMSLLHKSKKVRDAAVGGAHRWPTGEDAAAVVALLKQRKKATRLYAAMALARFPVDAVEGHRAALDAAAEQEKVGEVEDAIREVIARVDAGG